MVPPFSIFLLNFFSIWRVHYVKSAQIRIFFWSVFSHIWAKFSPNAGKYGTEKAPYFDTFHAVAVSTIIKIMHVFLTNHIGNYYSCQIVNYSWYTMIICFISLAYSHINRPRDYVKSFIINSQSDGVRFVR